MIIFVHSANLQKAVNCDRIQTMKEGKPTKPEGNKNMDLKEFAANRVIRNNYKVYMILKNAHHAFFTTCDNSTIINKSKVYGHRFMKTPSGGRYELRVWDTKNNKMIYVKNFVVID